MNTWNLLAVQFLSCSVWFTYFVIQWHFNLLGICNAMTLTVGWSRWIYQLLPSSVECHPRRVSWYDAKQPDPIYQPLRSGRIWRKVNRTFKRSLTEFPFSETSCLTKAEELSLSYYLPIWRENNWIHTFPKAIRAMWNAISLVQDLNSSRRIHFLRR